LHFALLLLVAMVSNLPAADAAPERPTVLVVIGAAGAPEYGEQFAEWADRWEQAADRGGASCVRIGDDSPTGTTDRDRLKGFFSAEPKDSTAPLWFVLLGHGTFDGRSAKFNLRGPDVSAGDVAGWLEPFRRPVAVIACSASSAPWINGLSRPGRVIVTATRSGYEQSFARFGDYLSSTIADPAVDLDKDGQTSLLEAFLSASRQTAEFYQAEARLTSETALIDDNGDGLGTPAAWFRGIHATRRARDGAVPDGTPAHQWHLIRTAAEDNMPPELRARRDELEQAIAKLRAAKNETTDEDAHYAQLEPLLIELARLYAGLEGS
jgi:hypothetical protein